MEPRRRRRHRQRRGGIRNNGKNGINGKNDKIGMGGRNGTNEHSFFAVPKLLCTNVFASQSDFFVGTFRVQTLANVVHAAGGGVTTEHLTDAAHTQICLVARRAAQCFHMYTSSNAPHWLKALMTQVSMGSRVLKTVRLLHRHSSISCLVANLLGLLSVVPLFLTH